MTPVFHITRNSSLIDELIGISIDNLTSDCNYTLRASQQDDNGVVWNSYGEFESDEHGVIDLCKRKPLSGSYDEIDPTGIFWSMVPDCEKEDAKPFNANSKLHPIETVLTLLKDTEVLVSKTISRLRVDPDVKRIPVKENGLVGALFIPAGQGLFSAIIYLEGSGGGHFDFPAGLLASRGIATLSLAYFKEKNLPDELYDIPLEYFEKAIDWLKKQKSIDGERIGVVGKSRGGELALILGSRYPSIKAVVSYVPSGITFGGFGSSPEVRPAWTYKGDAIPYYSQELQDKYRDKLAKCGNDKGVPVYMSFMSEHPDIGASIIPVEKINGPILLFSGKDDRIWASKFFSDVSIFRLNEHKHPFYFEHIAYEKVGHNIPIGLFPTTVLEVIHPVSKESVQFGGTPREISKAGIDAWDLVLNFLHEHIG